jgi:tetratricopeptide (TPR) repeat protein
MAWTHAILTIIVRVDTDAPYTSSETSGLSTIAELFDRAVAAKEAGRYDEAVSDLQACVDEDPDNPDAHWQIGLVQCFLGDFDASLAALEKAVKLNPNHVKARYDLGMTYMMLGYNDEARAQFEAVLALDPANDNAAKQLAYFP